MVAIGVWLLQTGYLPETRELVWTVERPQQLRELEVQVYDSDGALVKREELRFPSGAPSSIVQRLKLGSGDYRAEVFARYEGSAQPRHSTHAVRITGDEQYVIEVRR